MGASFGVATIAASRSASVFVNFFAKTRSNDIRDIWNETWKS